MRTGRLEISRVLGMEDEARRALEGLVRAAATRKTAVVGRFMPDEGVSGLLAGHGLSEEVEEEDFGRFEFVALPFAGVDPAAKRRWEESGVRLLDFSSAEVRRAQSALALLRTQGAQGLVIGRHDDPETRALAAAAGARILEDTSDTARLGYAPAYGVACQTTLSPRRVAWLSQQLRMRYRDSDVRFLNSVSPSMNARETALETRISACDLVVIVGTPGESTCEALAETALRHGKPAAVLRGSEDLEKPDLRGMTRIAFTAGGFATDAAVRAVAAALQRMLR